MSDEGGSTQVDPGGQNREDAALGPTARDQFPHTSLTQLIEVQSGGGAADEAIAELCRKYWYPLYAFLRRRGHDEPDAQDITQGFLSSFIEAGSFEAFEPSRGKLRSYLLGALKNYESNWRRSKQTIKAGGEVQFVSFEWLQAEDRYSKEPRDIESPDRLYDRGWALTLLGEARAELRRSYETGGNGRLFEVLQVFLDGTPPDFTYQQAATELGSSPGAVKTAVSRMRMRRREIVRAQIALTVASKSLVDEEIGFLLGLFGQTPNPDG